MDVTVACPAATRLADGSSWHMHPVTCLKCDTEVRLAHCTHQGHVCPADARKETTP